MSSGTDDAPADEHGELLVKEPSVSHTHQELFHYTTLAALRGILESNELWATSAFHLNDPTEMKIFWEHLHLPLAGEFENVGHERLSAIEGTKWEEVLPPNFPKRMAEIESRNWIGAAKGNLYGPRGIANPYVVSFAAHSGDHEHDGYRRQHGMLSQWRGYAIGEGVAIVFDVQALEALLAEEATAHRYWPLVLTEVVYEGILARFEPLVATFVGLAELVVHQREPDAQALLAKVTGDLGLAAARVKHHGYKEESEFRIVAGIPPDLRDPETDTSGIRGLLPYKPIYYRRGDTGSIPYIKLFQGSKKPLPITRVIVGPSRNQRAILQDVEALVGDRPITVQASEIPYVGSA